MLQRFENKLNLLIAQSSNILKINLTKKLKNYISICALIIIYIFRKDN